MGTSGLYGEKVENIGGKKRFLRSGRLRARGFGKRTKSQNNEKVTRRESRK